MPGRLMRLMRLHRGLAGRLLGCLLLGAATPGLAASCGVLTTPLSFGLYDVLLSPNNDTTGLITVTCTPGATDPLTTAYSISIAGTGTQGDTVRSLGSGGNRLRYQVYKDAGRSVVWGNTAATGVSGSTTSVAVLVPSLRIHTAYARMPSGQNVAPGIYLGSLMVTVDY